MKESLICTSIKQYLEILEKQGKLIYQRNNTGAAVLKYKGKTRFVKYGKVGAPDFYIFLKNGVTLHIEVKNESGEQSEMQVDFQNKISKLNHLYFIIRSLDDIIEIIKKYV